MSQSALAVGLILLLSVPVPASIPRQEVTPAQISSFHLGGSVHVIRLQVGRSKIQLAVSSGPDGLLLVDHQEAEFTDTIRSALQQISDREVKFLINTHWHLDHVGGNAAYGPKATIITTANARKRLTTKQAVWWQPEPFDPLPKVGWPTITFDDSLSLHFNDEEIQLWHFGPAHTDTDAVVYFTQSKVVHMGDLFQGRGQYSFGENVEGLARTFEQVLQRIPPDVKIITGHGNIATPDDLAAYRRILVDAIAWVRQEIEQGRTLEQIQAKDLPASWTDWYVQGVQTAKDWTENIYRSLEGELHPS